MISDPIADLLTRLRNAEMAGAKKVEAPLSKEKTAILEVLKKYGYILSFEVVRSENSNHQNILIDLKREKGARTNYKRISKPGQRMYVKAEDLKPVKSGLGISIVSTSKGIISNVEAKKLHIGGELLCEIW